MKNPLVGRRRWLLLPLTLVPALAWASAGGGGWGCEGLCALLGIGCC